MDDRKFDRQLTLHLEGLEPNQLPVRDITPWRRSMTLLLWGITLRTFQLEFLYLQYLIPALGTVLCLLGYRGLRRENGWLRGAWLLSLADVVRLGASLALDATRWGSPLTWDAPACEGYRAAMIFLDLFACFCLWRGLLAVQRKAGNPAPQAAPAGWLLVWRMGLTALALTDIGQLSGLLSWAVFGVLLLLYVLVVRSLWQLTRLLDEAGYEVKAPPVRLSDVQLGGLCLGLMAAAVLVGMLLFTRTPMQWTAADTSETASTAALRAELTELGFPEWILSDLSEEDVACLEGATAVRGWVSLSGPDREESDQDLLTFQFPDEEEGWDWLAASVLVELADPDSETGDRWVILVYYRYLDAPTVRTTEYLQIWPHTGADSDMTQTWGDETLLQGRVLYDLDGVTYSAPYATLEREAVTRSTFFGVSTGDCISASYSLPKTGGQFRGYLMYATERGPLSDRGIDTYVSGNANLYHQTTWLIYPYSKITDSVTNYSWNPEYLDMLSVWIAFDSVTNGE